MTSYKDQEHLPSEDRLKELLFGRRVVSVSTAFDFDNDGYDHPQGSITLDDGTVLGLAGNTGGCSHRPATTGALGCGEHLAPRRHRTRTVRYL